MRDWIEEHRVRLAALGIVLALFATPVLTLLWMTAVPGRS